MYVEDIERILTTELQLRFKKDGNTFTLIFEGTESGASLVTLLSVVEEILVIRTLVGDLSVINDLSENWEGAANFLMDCLSVSEQFSLAKVTLKDKRLFIVSEAHAPLVVAASNPKRSLVAILISNVAAADKMMKRFNEFILRFSPEGRPTPTPETT